MAAGVPEPVSGSHISRSTRLHHVGVSRLSIDHVEQPVSKIGNRRSSTIESFTEPEVLSGGGIVGTDAGLSVQNQFPAIPRLDQDRSRPTAPGKFAPIRRPDRIPRFLVEREKLGGALGVAVLDDQITVDDGGRGHSPWAGKGSQVFLPLEIPLEIETVQPSRTEEGDHPFPVRHAGRGRETVHLVGSLRCRHLHALLPEQLSGLPIQAMNPALAALFVRTGQEEAISPVHDRTLPLSPEFRLPLHLAFRPLHR